MQNATFQRHSLLYRRYIDDGKNIMTGTPQDVREMCKLISTYMPQDIEIEHNIKKFKNNYLDLNIKIDHETLVSGKLSYDIYQNNSTHTVTYTEHQATHATSSNG